MPFSTIIRSRLYRNVKTNYIAICQRNSPRRGSVSLCGRASWLEGGQLLQKGKTSRKLHAKQFICGEWKRERKSDGADALTSFRATSLEIRNQCSERTKDTSCELKVCPRPAQLSRARNYVNMWVYVCVCVYGVFVCALKA